MLLSREFLKIGLLVHKCAKYLAKSHSNTPYLEEVNKLNLIRVWSLIAVPRINSNTKNALRGTPLLIVRSKNTHILSNKLARKTCSPMFKNSKNFPKVLPKFVISRKPMYSIIVRKIIQYLHVLPH